MMFVDTGCWIAATVVSDSVHEVAQTYYVDLLSGCVGQFSFALMQRRTLEEAFTFDSETTSALGFGVGEKVRFRRPLL